MLRSFCRAKIRNARITSVELEYEGSIEIDKAILEASEILPWEMVQVLNMENGERFTTYVIPGLRDSGKICLKGPAARKGLVGDRVIIISYTMCTVEDWGNRSPKIITLSENNQIVK